MTADPKAYLQPGPGSNQARSHMQHGGVAILGYMSAKGATANMPANAPMAMLFVDNEAVRDTVSAYDPG